MQVPFRWSWASKHLISWVFINSSWCLSGFRALVGSRLLLGCDWLCWLSRRADWLRLSKEKASILHFSLFFVFLKKYFCNSQILLILYLKMCSLHALILLLLLKYGFYGPYKGLKISYRQSFLKFTWFMQIPSRPNTVSHPPALRSTVLNPI